MFYSPVVANPPLAIIGLNPGGGPGDFCEASATALPDRHEYVVENYRLAVRMRDLFERAQRTDVLKRSVKLNLSFFRSKDHAEWLSMDSGLRQELEAFSKVRVKRILDALAPGLILAEGMLTFRRLRAALDPRSAVERRASGAGNRCLLARARLEDGRTVLGIIHPSGAHISSLDWSRLVAALQQEL